MNDFIRNRRYGGNDILYHMSEDASLGKARLFNDAIGGLEDTSKILSGDIIAGLVLNHTIKEHSKLSLSGVKIAWANFKYRPGLRAAAEQISLPMKVFDKRYNAYSMALLIISIMFSESGLSNNISATSGAYGPFQIMNTVAYGYLKSIDPNKAMEYNTYLQKWYKAGIFNENRVCIKQTNESLPLQQWMDSVKHQYMNQLFRKHWEAIGTQMATFVKKGRWADTYRNVQYAAVAKKLGQYTTLPVFLVYGLNEAGAAVTYDAPTGFLHLRSDLNKNIQTYDPFSRALACYIKLLKASVDVKTALNVQL